MSIGSIECIHVIRPSCVILYSLLYQQQSPSQIQPYYIQCHISINIINTSPIIFVQYLNSYHYFCFYILIQKYIFKHQKCDPIFNQCILYVKLIHMLSQIHNIYIYYLYYMPCLYFVQEYLLNNIYLPLTQIEIVRLVDFQFFCDYLILCSLCVFNFHYDLQTILASNKSICVVIFYIFTVINIQNVG